MKFSIIISLPLYVFVMNKSSLVVLQFVIKRYGWLEKNSVFIWRYELKSPQFHYEFRKHNDRLKSSGGDLSTIVGNIALSWLPLRHIHCVYGTETWAEFIRGYGGLSHPWWFLLRARGG